MIRLSISSLNRARIRLPFNHHGMGITGKNYRGVADQYTPRR